jgi:hypothetical protein
MRGDSAVPSLRGATSCHRSDTRRILQAIRRAGGGCLVWALAWPVAGSPLAAQQPDPARTEYQREVFEYPRASHPDPFRSRSSPVGATPRIQEAPLLLLRGIVYATDPRESVAILVEAGSNRRVRARIGDRVGAVTVVGIHPRRVDLLVEEPGARRRVSLHLKAEREPGSRS